MSAARRIVQLALPLALVAVIGCADRVALVDDVPPPVVGGRRTPHGMYRGRRIVQAPRWRPPTDPAPVPSYRSPDWTPRVAERDWRYIVVHHSATGRGDAELFDRLHRDRGWDELGYHFVIGNGTLSADGEIEIGPRWAKQKHGAHCKVRGHPEYNERGIGICLVGHFNHDRPSEAQMRNLAWLIRGLMARYGIPKSRVLGHGQLKATDCPGKNFDYQDLYRRL